MICILLIGIIFSLLQKQMTLLKIFYKQTLQRIASGKGAQHGQKLSRSSGYLGSIQETKRNLEDIYKKS